jgi:formylglycine-generating enzyme required for sulfatase activity
MVRVPGGSASFGTAGPVEIEPFWIDRYEVTNRRFKEFVDAGGYRDPDFWTEPVVSDSDGKGPAPVGSYGGIGRYGTYDMAGNVREWCLNRGGDSRYNLGGAWPDPTYMYDGMEAVDPLDRPAKNVFRTIRTTDSITDAAMVSIDYLETRDDIDAKRLAFCGLSLGASWGPIFTAIEHPHGTFTSGTFLLRYPSTPR